MKNTDPIFPLCFCDRLRMATDGAGITALVGAYGCPLACRFCINPRTWHEPPEGQSAFTSVTPAELYDRVKQDNLYYLATGGGVCFGGGEPLLHAEFIAEFCRICPTEWHIYAESCLNIPTECVRIAAEVVDHFFVDVKDMNPAIYKSYTERDNAIVKENLSLLLSLAGTDRVTVRVPRIPHYNTEEDVERSVVELTAMGVTLVDRFIYRLPREKKI